MFAYVHFFEGTVLSNLNYFSFSGTTGEDEPSDPYLSPAVLRSRQDAAYRSVAALQLRVEELTLEVTKVTFLNSDKLEQF